MGTGAAERALHASFVGLPVSSVSGAAPVVRTSSVVSLRGVLGLGLGLLLVVVLLITGAGPPV